MSPLTVLVLLIKAVSFAVLGCIAYLVINPVNRWKYRHIPGPCYRAIFGNLPEFRKYGSHEFMVACRAKYGPVFKLWFGHRVWVVVCDPDLGKRVNYKCLNRPQIGDALIRGPVTRPENKGLFFTRDDVWRMVHRVWQPAFYADSVHACAPLMSDTSRRLVTRLQGLAGEGRPVDLWREVGNLTMAIVGTAAYGIDFHTFDADSATQQQPAASSTSVKLPLAAAVAAAAAAGAPSKAAQAAAAASHLPRSMHSGLAAAHVDVGQRAVGAQLVSSAQTLFASMGGTSGSIYQMAALLLPDSCRPLVAWAAHTFPDARFTAVMNARATVSSASMQLVQQFKQRQQQQEDASASGDAGLGGNAAPGGSGRVSRSGGAIAPGSFLGLLLAARGGTDGHGLSDLQMIMQANTFTLAGYETTANALAFSLWCISTHPEAEARLLQEAAAAAQPFHAYSRDMEQQFPYTCAVVSEALRLYPPGATTIREVPPAGRPLQLGGYAVAPGSSVFVASYVMQRDPELWPRAGEFLPERWLPGNEHLAAKNAAAYLPFGSGARMCIGYRFALQEVRLGLLELLSQFHFEVQWELMVPPPPQPHQQQQQQQGVEGGAEAGDKQQQQQQQRGSRALRTANGFTLSPVGGIWVKLEPRVPEVQPAV
ncbi:hypothetical protein OEZ85_008529 [Tetradesmus obliquus]|uniref:Cytochrome P450 n=1 Tax=Tetradesmus obliquus TaxID=3088 RepID=A0ABY8TJG2_TETOB|nr:hypothetical protein OEZ85_008529 [Tetradesmus obliquus]